MPNDDIKPTTKDNNKKLKTEAMPIYFDRFSYMPYPTTKKDEMRLQNSAKKFQEWLDRELARRNKSDKTILPTTLVDSEQPDQKIRTISFDEPNIGSGREEIISKISDDSKSPQALKKETKSRQGSLPPKKRTFTDLTKNDDNKKSIG
jgi:hypothetical protein